MADRPILFSGPMIRALLAGTKTQTRRVIKAPDLFISSGAVDGFGVMSMANGDIRPVPCPYGAPGTRLWVRETVDKKAWQKDCPDYAYKATIRDPLAKFGSKWTPSIHMPRFMSRITLEVTGVRVERLNDISEADAQAEGITYGPTCDEEGRSGGFHWDRTQENESVWPSAAAAYRHLWESINGPGSWDANPWVWVVEFKRVTP